MESSHQSIGASGRKLAAVNYQKIPALNPFAGNQTAWEDRFKRTPGGKKRSCKKRGGKKRSCKKRGGKKRSCKKRN